MNHYIGCRNGRTDAVIREAVERSARTGKPVVVVREATKKRILAKAREMRAKIPEPLVAEISTIHRGKAVYRCVWNQHPEMF